MFRYVIGFLIVVGLGYWAYSSWQERVETEGKRLEQEARCEVLRNSVAEMAAKSNAVTNWPASLASGKRSRRSPVLTAELQKLWVIERPILFIGNIKDITINKDGTYQVIVEHNCTGNRPIFLYNNIRISLRCPESLATPLLQAVRSEQTLRHFANAAVTGVIERIVTTSENDSDGDTSNVLTGVGKCVNALYLTERISL